MKKVEMIDITFSRPALEGLIRIFSAMDDCYHIPKIIDPTALMIDQCEIREILGKLRAEMEKGDDPIVVSMDFNDWCVYSGLLIGTDSSLPLENPEDFDVLETLYDDVVEMLTNDTGPSPTGPESCER